MKRVIIFFIISLSLFSKKIEGNDKLFSIVSPTQDIRVGDYIYQIDIKRLLEMTQMMESRGGRDNYRGRIAKTSYQLEYDTIKHYIPLCEELKCFLEDELGRKLVFGKEEDAIYYTYLLYMVKIRYHRDWLEKYIQYSRENDIEWLVYKILFNSINGKSNYKKWKEREKELLGGL